MLVRSRADINSRKQVVILSGFLGSGKTTLMNRIIKSRYGSRTALVVNEFGAIGIDHHLMLTSEGPQTVQLNDGCICCSLRGDLIKSLYQLIDLQSGFDTVVIESTGLADPGPIAQSLFADETIRAHFALKAIVTLVDAKNFRDQIFDDAQSVNQIAFADVILLNKIDLVSDREADEIETGISSINGAATLIRTRESAVDLDEIFGLRTGKQPPGFACVDAGIGAQAPRHLSDIETIAFAAPGELDPLALSRWFRSVISTSGPRLMRMKGVLNVRGDDDRFFFQGVRTDFEGRPGPAWSDGEQRTSQLVFIGRDLDRAAIIDGFRACLAGDASFDRKEADGFGRINVETSPQRLDQIRFWLRQNFMFGPDVPIVVKEVPCIKASCPPIETAIVAVLRDEPPRMFKVQHPIDEITFDHIYDLMENPMPCC